MNKETMIQNEIVDYLHVSKIPVWRINETSNLIGFPDLLAIDTRDGRFIGIEVKTEKGIVSSVQSVVHEIIKTAKGIVIVARSLDDVKRYFQD